MISEKSFSPLRAFKALLFSTVCLFAPVVLAQDYSPPPMFDDMTPPMVRPETQSGNIVEPKASANTQLPPALPSGQGRVVVLPRVSVNPDATPVTGAAGGGTSQQKAPVSPVVPADPIAPQVPAAVSAPAKPKMMQPIIEERDLKQEKAPSRPAFKATPKPVPVKKPEAPKPPEPSKKVETQVEAPKPDPKKAETPATEAVAPVPAQADAVVPSPAKAEEVTSEPQAKVMPAVPASPSAKPAATSGDDRTQVIKSEQVPREPTESAIKGPKTMPALPPVNVDQQVTFEGSNDKADAAPTIMERHLQQLDEEKASKPAVETNVAPAAEAVAPAAFTAGDQGVMKKTIPFEAGQVSLPADQSAPIVATVVNELNKDEKEAWRVQIKSFATPHGNGVSTDKRIALSRALSLRTTLITKGISASRIDVLAQGLDGGGKPVTAESNIPADRIDIYLYGPPVE